LGGSKGRGREVVRLMVVESGEDLKRENLPIKHWILPARLRKVMIFILCAGRTIATCVFLGVKLPAALTI
jgi:hypothetical protein